MLENIGCFGHFDHKGREPLGEEIGGSNAGEDPINDANHRCFGWNKTADLRQQDKQGRLAGVGAFAGRVWAGQDQEMRGAIKLQIVWDKNVTLCFYNGMTAFGD